MGLKMRPTIFNILMIIFILFVKVSGQEVEKYSVEVKSHNKVGDINKIEFTASVFENSKILGKEGKIYGSETVSYTVELEYTAEVLELNEENKITKSKIIFTKAMCRQYKVYAPMFFVLNKAYILKKENGEGKLYYQGFEIKDEMRKSITASLPLKVGEFNKILIQNAKVGEKVESLDVVIPEGVTKDFEINDAWSFTTINSFDKHKEKNEKCAKVTQKKFFTSTSREKPKWCKKITFETSYIRDFYVGLDSNRLYESSWVEITTLIKEDADIDSPELGPVNIEELTRIEFLTK